jgi:pyruvate dehydrogenase E2 component (dihydrolipoamide acetyltransferase)
MGFVFELPEVGEGVVEAEVVKWHVKPGDVVTQDQPLCEITTDKAQLEISSPRGGTIVKLFGKPGDLIKVHHPLVEYGDGAAAPAPAPAAPAPAPAPAAPKAAPPEARGPTKAAPAVRRHAKELDVDIHQVAGTGPGGRVTHDDLTAFQSEPEVLPIAPVALPQVVASGKEERVPLIGIRRKIAEQMVRAVQTAPHFTYVEEVDCTKLVALRDAARPFAEKRGVKLTYLPIIMKAVSIALREFPNVNAWMDEAKSELVVKGDHHFGIATDTPNGLMVPVIRSVEQKSVLTVAAELADLTTRTRAGKARIDELKGSTLTFTGVGNIGGVMATPILNVPEVAIMAINAIRPTPSVVDGAIVIRQKTLLSPSFDHRIVDGAVAARFVAAVKNLIENPEILMMELA